MGMYTWYQINTTLKKDTPKQLLNILTAFVEKEDVEGMSPDLLPTHPLFDTDRYSCIGHDMDMSFYVGPMTWPPKPQMRYNNIEFNEDGTTAFRIRGSLKNYCSEIELFVDLIAPYVLTEGEETVIGEWQYEENETESDIIIKNSKLKGY